MTREGKFRWVVTAVCSREERARQFLSLAQVITPAKQRLKVAAEMHWYFTRKRDAERFCRSARKAPNGFLRVYVARR